LPTALAPIGLITVPAAIRRVVLRRDRAVAAEETMTALRLRGELRAALGAAALDFGGHAGTPLAALTSSKVRPSSASTAARPVNFDQRLIATSQ
jgi:hypothetical protein